MMQVAAVEDHARDRRADVDRLPLLFGDFAQDPVQMRAGAPGKVGVMELVFERRDEETRLVHSYTTGQQTVRRALHIDPELPGMAVGIVQTITSGVVQGDRMRADVVARANSQALVTTQSATKILSMDTNYATQRINISVEPGAYLEYLPGMLIPHAHSRFYQESEITVANDATLVFCEVVSPGRVARGEVFEYDVLMTSVEARNSDGELRLLDNIVLTPGEARPTRSGLLGGRDYFASFYVLTQATDAARLATVLGACAEGTSRVDGGASRLPHDDGVVLRVVGDRWQDVETAIYRAWKATRSELLGVDVPRINTFKYGREPATEWDAEEDADHTD